MWYILQTLQRNELTYEHIYRYDLWYISMYVQNRVLHLHEPAFVGIMAIRLFTEYHFTTDVFELIPVGQNDNSISLNFTWNESDDVQALLYGLFTVKHNFYENSYTYGYDWNKWMWVKYHEPAVVSYSQRVVVLAFITWISIMHLHIYGMGRVWIRFEQISSPYYIFSWNS